MLRSGPYRTEMNMDLTGFALCGRACRNEQRALAPKAPRSLLLWMDFMVVPVQCSREPTDKSESTCCFCSAACRISRER